MICNVRYSSGPNIVPVRFFIVLQDKYLASLFSVNATRTCEPFNLQVSLISSCVSSASLNMNPEPAVPYHVLCPTFTLSVTDLDNGNHAVYYNTVGSGQTVASKSTGFADFF